VIGFPVMFYLLFGIMNRNETMHGGAIVAKCRRSGICWRSAWLASRSA
jgi:hypothetical protein